MPIVDADAALRQDRHFLLWAKEENRADEGVLRALVANMGESVSRRQDDVLDSVLDRDSWNVSDETFKAILAEDVIDDGSGRHNWRTGKLAAYAQLFPADDLSIAALAALESWFRADRATRGHRDWDDTLAIAFGTADPSDLPTIVSRAHTRIRMGLPDLYLSMFTKPLTRRLRMDSEAIEAFRTALSEPMSIREDSPIFAQPWDPIADARADLQPLQRMYLFATVLRQAGALPQQEATAAAEALVSASPDTVVHNPFTNHEGPSASPSWISTRTDNVAIGLATCDSARARPNDGGSTPVASRRRRIRRFGRALPPTWTSGALIARQGDGMKWRACPVAMQQTTAIID